MTNSKNTKHKKIQSSKNIKANATRYYKGRIEIIPSGIGFVVTEDFPVDIKIAHKDLNGALSQDEVKVSIINQSTKGGKRITGKVEKITKRNQIPYVGVLHQNKGHTFFISEEPPCYKDFYIPNFKNDQYKEGDKVIMKFESWTDLKNNPIGIITGILDSKNAQDMAMNKLLISKGFHLNFSEKVLDEVKLLSDVISQQDINERRDMRDVLTFTIDPKDAKDFDDALSFRILSNGNSEIGIHIADVSHYIMEDTELDKEAYLRATSVYLPDRVLPMLPEEISNGLCSLRPNEDKRTFSVVVELDAKANILNQWIGKTLTHSNRRYTYEEVQTVIEGGVDENKEVINQIQKLATILRNERFKKGAINFSSTESGFIFNDELEPIGIKVKISQESHQLIEEYMLLANKIVAEYIAKYKLKDNTNPVGIYRSHDKPNEEKLNTFIAFARTLGYEINNDNSKLLSKSFNNMLEESMNKPESQILQSLGIRTMSKAEYSTINIGHYGLAFEYYSHFTSPIRRYPDILVHRIIHQLLTNSYKPIKQLALKAQHCSTQEKKATESEREANKFFQVFFMQKYIGQEFEGIISGVAPFGFWVETIDHRCEGLVSIKDNFPDEQYEFKPESYMLQSSNGKTFQMGQNVKIKVTSANIDKKQLDYGIVQ